MAGRERRRRSCIASTLPRRVYSGTNRNRSRSRSSRPIGWRASCDRTTIQSSSTACVNSSTLRVDRVQREVVERGDPARIGRPRPHEQVAEEGERPRAVARCPAR